MSFIDTLSNLAKKASDMLDNPAIPAAIQIGNDVLELIDKAKDVVRETDVPKLEAMREELEPKVMAHAEITETALRAG